MEKNNLLIAQPGWELSTEVLEICRPAQEILGITYLDYGRFYPDGSIAALYSDREYVKFFLTDNVYEEKKPNRVLSPGKHLWSTYIPDSFLKVVAKKFNHAHGVTIVNQTKDYLETYSVATTANNSAILNLYLNQPALLQQFIDYFKKKAARLIHIADDNRIIIPAPSSENKLSIDPYSDAAEKFAQHIEKDKLSSSEIASKETSYTLSINRIHVPLTHREAQCVYLLSQGQTSKGIAKKLAISPRTVEVYLDQVRSKTASKNRWELLGKLNRCEVDELERALA